MEKLAALVKSYDFFRQENITEEHYESVKISFLYNACCVIRL